jgi:hypothetical protein
MPVMAEAGDVGEGIAVEEEVVVHVMDVAEAVDVLEEERALASTFKMRLHFLLYRHPLV